MKLLFTGGHHTSALAVIDALISKTASQLDSPSAKKQEPSSSNSQADKLASCPAVKLIFLGHKFSMHGSGIESAEYQEITARGIPFYDLKAGKLYRTWNPLEWLRLIFGFFQAFWILLRERPTLIVSFGGYLAAPVVFAGWLLRIPSVTHEQTVVSGWANRFIARFARKIFISWPQSAKYFPEEKTVLTGLPLRKEIVTLAKYLDTEEVGEDKKHVLGTSEMLNDKWKMSYTIYITGGKQGSQTINKAVEGCLVKLLEKFSIIHQCGALDEEKFLRLEENLPQKLKARYIVKDFFPGKQVARAYRSADFVVGRSGAHTTYELSALGKPAVLIPIPWVSHNEQKKNAQILEEVGTARILPESRLSPKSLYETCSQFAQSLDMYQKKAVNARKLVTLKAGKNIAQELEKICK